MVTEIVVGVVLLLIGGGAAAWWRARGRSLAGHVTRDPGVHAYISTDFQIVWSGAPPGWIAQNAYFPNGLPRDDMPSSRATWSEWVSRNGGMPMWSQTVTIHVVGRSPTTVILLTPVVEVIEWDDISTGVAAVWPAGGAAIHPKGFYADLDAMGPDGRPVVQSIDASGDVSIPASQSFSLVTNGVERFDIQLTSGVPRIYKWRVQIPVLIDGRTEMLNPHPASDPYLQFAGPYMEKVYSWDEIGETWT